MRGLGPIEPASSHQVLIGQTLIMIGTYGIVLPRCGLELYSRVPPGEVSLKKMRQAGRRGLLTGVRPNARGALRAAVAAPQFSVFNFQFSIFNRSWISSDT